MKKNVLSLWVGFFTKLAILSLYFLISACQILPKDFSLGKPALESIKSHQFINKANENVIGQIAVVEKYQGESLIDIARHYGLGFNEIVRANQDINIWQLEKEDSVVLPLKFILPDTSPQGVVINVANMRMFYYVAPFGGNNSATILSFPLGIGKEGWSTPLGKTKIISKTMSPSWRVPISIRREHALKGDPLPAVVKAGPNNPLGQYAMRLGFPGYLIHGTNKPYGVGLRVSHGCIRMYPENIEAVFSQLPVGTKVNIVDQPFLIGWQENMLYLEVHPSVIKQKNYHIQIKNKLKKKFSQYPQGKNIEIDWNTVEQVITQTKGLPFSVLNNGGYSFEFTRKYPKVKRPMILNNIPRVPNLLEGEWSILVETYSEQVNAEKLSAILNHQGPQITSRVSKNKHLYQVVSGPFSSKKLAKQTVKRIFREFEIVALKVQKYRAY